MIKFLKEYFQELLQSESKQTLTMRSIKRFFKKKHARAYPIGESSQEWTIFLTATHINYTDYDIPFEYNIGTPESHWIELPKNFMLVGLQHNKTKIRRFLICPTNFRG